MRYRMPAVAVACLAILTCGGEPTEPAVADAARDGLVVSADAPGPSGYAVVQFGREQQGTEFFPPGSHDASFHAKDAIRPRTVVISAGGTVDFILAAAHKIAIYEPGVGVGDIDVSLLEPPVGAPPGFPPIINDPDGRIVRGNLWFGPPTVWSWTFDEPGRYLVICEVLPHFAVANMYAWVEVK